MQPTARVWVTLALAGLLSTLAVVAGRPELLGGVVVLGTVLLGRQVLFIRRAGSTLSGLTVEQTTDRDAVQSGETTLLSVTGLRHDHSDLSVSLTVDLPITATCRSGSRTVTLPPGTERATETVVLEWPVAGSHAVGPPSVTLTDEWFTEELKWGESVGIVVQPPEPRRLHIGRGGDRYPPAYGEHDAGRIGLGLDPAELRPYQPGDTMKRIDWKATARLAEPHIRTHEARTDRTVLLVVDTRSTMATGGPGESKLAYLREVALSIASRARDQRDPTGLVTVTSDGVDSHLPSGTTPEHTATLRRLLLDLSTENGTTSSRNETQLVTRLAGEPGMAVTGDAFARTLEPFLADRDYAWRFDDRPLANGVTVATARESPPVWTLIATDDTNPVEVRAAVDIARAKAGHVLVLLTPSVLFEPAGMGNLEGAYRRYVRFEEFRSELDAIESVTALEVAPGDRLSSILSVDTRRAGVET